MTCELSAVSKIITMSILKLATDIMAIGRTKL
jgi:hypothetical protein